MDRSTKKTNSDKVNNESSSTRSHVSYNTVRVKRDSVRRNTKTSSERFLQDYLSENPNRTEQIFGEVLEQINNQR